MSLKIYLQAEHECERCGQKTFRDFIRLGCSGQPNDPHADVCTALDCDAETCSDCLALPDDQPQVEAAHLRRCVEFKPEDEPDPDPDYHAPVVMGNRVSCF